MARFTITAICLLCAVGLCVSLKIGAFNVRVFGRTKFSKRDVVSTLVQIIRRYDVVLLQELRDSSETVIYSFLQELNIATAGDPMYNVEVSPRLGRSSSKEQYAFLYREDTVEVIETLQFNDTVDDTFEREPYMVFVRTKLEDLPNFFLVGIHTRPDDAFAEIDALSRVYDEAVCYFETESGMILGDFNADCRYLSMASYHALSLVTDKRFTWPLYLVDTTTTSTSCAYDRFVIAGEIENLVRYGNARVFQFDQEYELTEQQTLDVSDHYPVEIDLQSKWSFICGEKLYSKH